MVRQISKESHLKRPFNKRHGKRCQTLLKSEGQQLCLFVNTLTADDKYSPLNRDNLMQPIQLQLSKTQKTFSHFVFEFSEFRLNFEHFF